MKVNNIKLKNFGIFYDENKLNFSLDDENKNIILIGGQNGAGKTTLLEAIRLALYGSVALGYKTNTTKYFDYIKKKINYSALEDDEQSEMSIILNLSLNKKGNIKRYIIKRKWNFEEKLSENLIVTDHNTNILNDKETLEFENYIRTLFPPALFDFFLFDGENMGDLLYNKKFNDILKKAIITVFNLNLTNTLKEDINNLLSTQLETKSLSKPEEEFTKKKQEYNQLKSKIKKQEEELKNTKQKIKNLNLKQEELNERFNTLGGIHADKREEIKEKIKELEVKKEKYRSFLNDYYETFFPFIINKDLLKEIKNQLHKETDYKKYMDIKENLNNEFFSNLDEELKQIDNIGKDKSEILTSKVVNVIDKSFKPDFNINQFNQIHKLSSNNKNDLLNTIQKIEDFNTPEVIEKANKIENINEKLKKLNNKLQKNKENSDLQGLLDQIQQCHLEVSKLKETKEELNEKIETNKTELKQLEEEKNEKYKKLKEAKKSSNIPLLCDKIENIISKYNRTQINNKLKIVKEKFLKNINKLISHENYIKDIEIDSETFEIKLYSNTNDLLNDLSAGEQELVILALLWSLANSSKRQFPLILDTLLGRIDEDHRENIIKNLLPKTNSQVIILATDSEINNKLYHKLIPYIERSYLIDKTDKLNHKSTIKQNYFFGDDKNEIQTKNFKTDERNFKETSV
ncbi:hypothetical protein JCM16358_20530 [Halanaerocella petrolearia]